MYNNFLVLEIFADDKIMTNISVAIWGKFLKNLISIRDELILRNRQSLSGYHILKYTTEFINEKKKNTTELTVKKIIISEIQLAWKIQEKMYVFKEA